VPQSSTFQKVIFLSALDRLTLLAVHLLYSAEVG